MWLTVAVLLLLATGHQLDITKPIDPMQLMKVYYVDGSTQVLSDVVVLTPDSTSKAGRVTSLYNIKSKNWHVKVQFSVYTRNKLFGDGLAVWFTDTQIFKGNAMGGPNSWKGVAVFVDTYDNNKNRDNPLILGIVNDGKKVYEPNDDGLGISNGHCKYKEMQFKKGSSTLMDISLRDGSFHVSIGRDGNMIDCFTIDGVDIESPYLSFSANTGDLSEVVEIQNVEVVEEGGDQHRGASGNVPQKSKKRQMIVPEDGLTTLGINEADLFDGAETEGEKIHVATSKLVQSLVTIEKRAQEIQNTATANINKYKDILRRMNEAFTSVRDGSNIGDFDSLMNQLKYIEEYYEVVKDKGVDVSGLVRRLTEKSKSMKPISAESHTLFWTLVVVSHVVIVACIVYIFMNKRSVTRKSL